MDVLRPPIIRIGNRCYRRNHIEQGSNSEYNEEDEFVLPVEEDIYEETCDELSQIESTPEGFKLSIDLPSAYFKFIIGKKGETKRRMENETKTQIKIPKQGTEGEIIILGREKRGIDSALTRINMLVDSARQKQPFTHFLSFPMAGSSIKEKFFEFTDDVLRFCAGDHGIDKSIFQNPSKLHLTVGTLVLLNDKELSGAKAFLDRCKEGFIDSMIQGQALTARIRGLEYMNDDPSNVDVLYAKVELLDGSERLQLIADQLVSRFTSEGLMQRDYDRVKLHVTVMNTLFRQSSSADKQHKTQKREAFDASNVLKLYGDYDFGVHVIDSCHLSVRYSTACTGYYSAAHQINLT